MHTRAPAPPTPVGTRATRPPPRITTARRLPMPYNPEAVSRIVARARMVQDFLEVPFALENTSSYLTYRSSTLSEWEFIGEIADRADIGILFDVNNVFVNAVNHRYDAHDFLRCLPGERIRWTFGKASGTVTAASDGTVTVPRLRLGADWTQLVLERG